MLMPFCNVWKASTTTMGRSCVRRWMSQRYTTVTPATTAASLSRKDQYSNIATTNCNISSEQQQHSNMQIRFLASTQEYDSKQKSQPTTTTTAKIQLYQYAICPFCHRVKALLDYAGVDYQVTEVNPLTKAEIKPWKTDYTKVPIATLSSDEDGDVVVPLFGSDVIVQGLLKSPIIQTRLQERWLGSNGSSSSSMTLSDFSTAPTVATWTNFAVNELAVLLYPNMCRTWGDSYRAFEYVHATATFGPLQRVMIQILGSLVRRHMHLEYKNDCASYVAVAHDFTCSFYLVGLYSIRNFRLCTWRLPR
jgi:glutaredoxin